MRVGLFVRKGPKTLFCSTKITSGPLLRKNGQKNLYTVFFLPGVLRKNASNMGQNRENVDIPTKSPCPLLNALPTFLAIWPLLAIFSQNLKNFYNILITFSCEFPVNFGKNAHFCGQNPKLKIDLSVLATFLATTFTL